ncbi:hypothetical protein H072_225 [Dactylellina haptotyla CBS 200.50]|uniref:Uncharacterized protein n=1 Tax=Dactylellina haptotyla (strain CBS 200.50) TaxID=1284197 RepID=S8AS87_DACHA|nr:hypothetical protein H072_225 [Dactylellina haptotyla CBS 200.50]
MPVDLILKTVKLISRLKSGKLFLPRHINIGYIDHNQRYRVLRMLLTPTTTSHHLKKAVRAALNLEREARLWVGMLPYGFEIEDYRIHHVIHLLSGNYISPQNYLRLFMPRRSSFPYIPAKRYFGRLLSRKDNLRQLLKPWKQDALHFWVGLDDRYVDVRGYLTTLNASKCIAQEKRDISTRCQERLRDEVVYAYGLLRTFQSGNEEDGGTGWWPFEDYMERYRCQITDEYLTAQQTCATLIYPYSSMFDLAGLDTELVAQLASADNGLVMYEPVARMFDDFGITIKKLLVREGGEGEGVRRVGYFLKVANQSLMNRSVFAGEDLEGIEERRKMRYSDLDGKEIFFSDGNEMTPLDQFLDWHAKMAVYLVEHGKKTKMQQDELEVMSNGSSAYPTSRNSHESMSIEFAIGNSYILN